MTSNAEISAVSSYPIELVSLYGRPVLVAGAGRRAASRIAGLVAAGARIYVVAPEISEEMSRWFFELERIERRFVRAEDVNDKALVIAATNDRKANRMLVRAARAEAILVTAVDDPAGSDFLSPAVVRRGPVHFAIGTSGGSPLLAAQLRRVLDAALPKSVGSVAELFVRLRRSGLNGASRRARLLRALADPKLSRLVDLGRFEEAEGRLAEVLREKDEPFEAGSVCIIGAGPGSKALLTLRAVDRIQRADLILHDALIDREALALALTGTCVLCVGRRAHDPSAPRDHSETIAMMIQSAKSGHRVVRLHGGDPLVFGRAGEEIDALEKAEIPFDVVPGVSSVLAAAASAKVPLTRRRIARGFTVRTGRTEDGDGSGALPREEETVVVLMGLGTIDQVARTLIAEGRSSDLPAIVVSRVSTKNERIVRGTLGTIASNVRGAELPGPATLICGAVAALRDR